MLNIFWAISCLFLLGISSETETDKAYPNQWRSFRNGGICSESGNTLPMNWNEESGIAWQVELEGYGQSEPVIFGDSVFLTSVLGDMKATLVVTCLSLNTGDIKWSKKFEASHQAPSNYMNSRAAPTPVVDETAVYAFFESGDLVAISHEGELQWKIDLSEAFGPFKNNHGLGSSPTQNKDFVFLNLEHQGPSSLVAISKTDGTVAWKQPRPSSSTWSSPIVCKIREREQLVVSSGGSVSGYNVTDGNQLWKIEPIKGNSVPSPTYANGRLFIGARLPEFGGANEARKSNLCIEFNEAGEPNVKWRSQKALADYASPVVAGPYAYIVDKNGVLHCMDVEDGQPMYAERLGLNVWATPIVQDGHLFILGKDGQSKVIKTGDVYKEVAFNRLWDADAPPRPEAYQEFTPTEEPGGESESANRSNQMINQMMKSDANGDGKLSGGELPENFRDSLAKFDSNNDQMLDRTELDEMAEQFAARRSGSRESSRDPIVYGAAAASGRLLVRTGTRLYCITDEVVDND